MLAVTASRYALTSVVAEQPEPLLVASSWKMTTAG